MELSLILPLLQSIKGVTFASLDAQTKRSGIRKVTLGEQILLCNVQGKRSVYESMVKRRLAKIGSDPSFMVGPLPWGNRLNDFPSCVIEHNGKYYLQTILIKEGEDAYYIGNRVVDPAGLGLRDNRRGNSQGLPEEMAVVVNTYALESITAVRLLGEELVAPNGLAA